MRYRFAPLFALALAPSAIAQGAAPIAVAQPGADQLVAARDLLTVMFPPAEREQLFQTVIRSMMANIIAGAKQAAGKSLDARADAIISRFVSDAEADATSSLRGSMPALFEAYARAYARNFSTSDLREIVEFVGTPAGRKFTQRSQFLMTDPDVAKWQTDEVAGSFTRLRPRIEAMKAELAALKPASGSQH